MNYGRNKLEPDKLFSEEKIADYDKLDREIIGRLPIAERISAYIEDGEIKKASDLADSSISSSDMNRTEKIIQALSMLKSEKNIELLQKQLKKNTEYPDIRNKIVMALGNIGSEKVIELLIPLLNDENVPSVKNSAAIALGNISTERAIAPLIAILQNQNVAMDLRMKAAEVLGNIGNEKAIKLLIAALKNQDVYVRTAVEALGNIGNERAIEPLIDCLEHECDSVRETVAEALGKIGTERAIARSLLFCKIRMWLRI